MTSPLRRDVLSELWSPLCAIGVRGPERPNAQICVSVFGASVVPDRPRVIVALSKTNYTHDLVLAAGTLAVTLLAAGQLSLLDRLGLRSGRDGDKLAGIEHALTEAGDPYFPGGVGYLDCKVLERSDLGDASAFLCAVRSREMLRADAVMRWAEAQQRVGVEFLERWEEKRRREQELARATMRWR